LLSRAAAQVAQFSLVFLHLFAQFSDSAPRAGLLSGAFRLANDGLLLAD
jgi:hypothetical protein